MTLQKKITVEARGEVLQLKDTIDVMVDQLNAFASEVARVAREDGTEETARRRSPTYRGVAATWRRPRNRGSTFRIAGNLWLRSVM